MEPLPASQHNLICSIAFHPYWLFRYCKDVRSRLRYKWTAVFSFSVTKVTTESFNKKDPEVNVAIFANVDAFNFVDVAAET